MEQEKCVALSNPMVKNYLTAENLIFFRFIIKRKDGKENVVAVDKKITQNQKPSHPKAHNKKT